MGTKGNYTLNTRTTLKTWKEKADGGPLLQLKISPTISLELQSSQPSAIATAANLTLRVQRRYCSDKYCRFIDCAFRSQLWSTKKFRHFSVMKLQRRLIRGTTPMSRGWNLPPQYENSI